MAENGVVYRLGWVLYWTFCIIAGLSVLAALATLFGQKPQTVWLPGTFAAAVWLMGRAIRYILAGD